MKTINQIHQQIRESQSLDSRRAVRVIASEVGKSESTVYGWLSGKKPPETTLRLLNLLFDQDSRVT